MATDIGVKLAVEGENTFKSAIKAANAEIKALDAELKNVVSAFDDQTSAQEKAAAQMEVMGRQVDAQKQKLEVLGQQYDNASSRLEELGAALESEKAKRDELAAALEETKQKEGENSEAAKAAAAALTEQEAAVNRAATAYNRQAAETANLERQMSQTEAAINDTSHQMDNLGDAVDEAAEDMDDAGDSAGRFGDILAAKLTSEAIIAGLKKLGQALKDIMEDTVEYGDEVDKMSQKVGLSTDAYQEWNYVMKISGTEMSSCTTGLKTLTNTFDDAINGSASAEEKFTRLGLSLEQLNGLSREDLFATVVNALQRVEDETTRAALANDMFGKSGQNLIPMFNLTEDELADLRQEAHDLGAVMSEEDVQAAADLHDALTALEEAQGGLARGIVSDMVPALTDAVNLMADLMGLINESDIDLGGIMMGGLTGGGTSGLLHARQEILDTATATKELETGTQSVTEAVEGLTGAEEQLGNQIEYNSDKVMDYSERVKALLDGGYIDWQEAADLLGISEQELEWRIQAVTHAQEEAEAETGALTSAHMEEIEALEKQQEAYRDLVSELGKMPGALSAAGYSATEMANLLTKTGRSADDFASAIESTRETVVNGFEEMSEQSELTAQEMIDNLTANLQAQQSWAGNMEALWAQSFSDAGMGGTVREFLAFMADQGPEFAGVVQEWVNSGYDQLVEAAELWAQAGDESARETAERIEMDAQLAADAGETLADSGAEGMASGDFDGAGSEASSEFTSGVRSGTGNAQRAGVSLGTSAKSGAGSVSLYPTGYNAAQGYAQGISDGTNLAVNAAVRMVQLTIDMAKKTQASQSPSRIFRDEVGWMAAKGYAIGIENGTGEVETASADMVRAAIQAANGELSNVSATTARLRKLLASASSERDYEDHLKRLSDLRKKYNEAEATDRADIQKEIADEEDSWNQKVLQSRLDAIEEATEAWQDSLNRQLDAANYTLKALEVSHKATSESTINIYKQMQEAIHQQAEEARALGYAENSEYIMSLKEQWLDAQADINKAWEDGVDDFFRTAEHQRMIQEKNGKATLVSTVQFNKDMQRQIHSYAEEARRKGYTEDSEFIQNLQEMWYDYRDNTAEAIQDVANMAIEAYGKAWDQIKSDRDKFAASMAGYGDLFSYLDEDRGTLEIENIKDQTQAIEEYGDMLMELKSRGVEGDLLQEILGMSHKDAWNYGNALLELTDEAWNDYMQAYRTKHSLADAIAENFYQEDFDQMKDIGQIMAEKLLEGFAGEDGWLADQIYQTIMDGYSRAEGMVMTGTAPASSEDLYGLASAINAYRTKGGLETQILQITIQSVLDGQVVAETMVDPIIQASAANGTPFYQQQG